MLKYSLYMLMSKNSNWNFQYASFFFMFPVVFSEKLNLSPLTLSLFVLSSAILMLMDFSENSSAKNFSLLSFLKKASMFTFIAFFFAESLIMIYIFFELILIPTILIITGWSKSPERSKASLYLFFYTLCGSLPLLLSIVFFSELNFSSTQMILPLNFVDPVIEMSLSVAFLMKTPMLLLHVWLPKAHVEASTAGSMLLAGVLLKLGGVGLLMMKHTSPSCLISPTIFSFNIIFNIYAAACCLCKTDIKEIVAFSSISHMASMLVLMFTSAASSLSPASLIMFSHGFCASGLFLTVGNLYKNSNSRNIIMNKGIVKLTPWLSVGFFCLLAMNSAAPMTLNLLAEMSFISSSLAWSSFTMPTLFVSIFFSALFSMFLFKTLTHGPSNTMSKTKMYMVYKEMLAQYLHIWPLIILCFVSV